MMGRTTATSQKAGTLGDTAGAPGAGLSSVSDAKQGPQQPLAASVGPTTNPAAILGFDTLDAKLGVPDDEDEWQPRHQVKQEEPHIPTTSHGPPRSVATPTRPKLSYAVVSGHHTIAADGRTKTGARVPEKLTLSILNDQQKLTAWISGAQGYMNIVLGEGKTPVTFSVECLSGEERQGVLDTIRDAVEEGWHVLPLEEEEAVENDVLLGLLDALARQRGDAPVPILPWVPRFAQAGGKPLKACLLVRESGKVEDLQSAVAGVNAQILRCDRGQPLYHAHMEAGTRPTALEVAKLTTKEESDSLGKYLIIRFAEVVKK